MSDVRLNYIRLVINESEKQAPVAARGCGCGDTKPHMHCGTCYYRGPFTEENFPWWPTYSLCWDCWFRNYYELPRLAWWRVAA